MAKKPATKTKKPAAKKATSKPAPKRVASMPAAKKPAKKAAVKKATPKKVAGKKAAVKPAAKKAVAKKAVSTKSVTKPVTKKATVKPATKKPTPAKAATKPAAKKPLAKKAVAKPKTVKKPAIKKAAPKKVTSKPATKRSTPKAKPKAKTQSKPKTQTATGRVPLSDPGPAEVLGRITWLMLQSEAHKHMFLADLEWRVLPPVLLKQFRLFRKSGNPIGYAAWAFLDEETDKRLRKGDVKLTPDQWRAGPNLWLLDLVAPFGGQETMLKEIAAKVFKGKAFRTLVPKKDGTGMRAVE